MSVSIVPATALQADVYVRALDARDARFDGVFFVGIITTLIYCRPVCPARVSYHDHRRFFRSAAAAERAGFRPCLRCRPELAPGLALIDAIPRLARDAANRIAAGALNGHSVTELAGDLGVSERHLRRALEREIGASPLELAQTHRLLLAKRLLADTGLSIARIAYASGFQSLRRFNAAFRAQYRMPPSALRASRRLHSGQARSDGIRGAYAPLRRRSKCRVQSRHPHDRRWGSLHARASEHGDARRFEKGRAKRSSESALTAARSISGSSRRTSTT